MKKAHSALPAENDDQSTAQDVLLTEFPLTMDTSGIFYVEARRRIRCGEKLLRQLQSELSTLEDAASNVAAMSATEEERIDFILGIGGIETNFGKMTKEFFVADILLAASAEAYINLVARHVLSGTEAECFDKLSPVGKWLFLPRVMKLNWQPKMDSEPLQSFQALVKRRNQVVHPQPKKIPCLLKLAELMSRLGLDPKQSLRGANSVKNLISQFAKSWRGSNGPNWLHENSARRHPPCFTFGDPDRPMRLGRRRRKSKKGHL